MLHTMLQLWGGLFYLLNKIFYSAAERSDDNQKRRWLIWAWTTFLIGLPAWIWLFVINERWMAAAIEVGGAPAMLLGLIIVIKGEEKNSPRWLDYLARLAAILGFVYSVYQVGGLKTMTQFLEIGLVSGFLGGTYLLAKQKAQGYLWFLLMHFSTALLMYIDSSPWLAFQQVISIGFVGDAYIAQNKRRRKT
jgi:hypothetical protein